MLLAQNAYTYRYRIRTWYYFSLAFIDGDGLTFWIDETALTAWRNTQVRRGLGAPRIYSDTAIQGAVVVTYPA